MSDEKKIAKQLEKFRDSIDKIDNELLSLMNQRAKIAQEIALIKSNSTSDQTVYRPRREAQLIKTLLESNSGPLQNETILTVFRELMSGCRSLQQPMEVAYFGPAGTYTHQAVLSNFGHAIKAKPLGAIDEVFREVESGEAAYGLVPVENSTEGVVNHTLDTFIHSSLKICAEVTLKIHHHVLSNAETLEQIKTLYAHQQSFAQCREWIDSHLMNVERVPVSSNAEAASHTSSNKEAGAIAGDLAAEIYHLNILANKIEDNPSNSTRFLVIAQDFPKPSGNDKTSLLVSTADKPGSLYRILEIFYQHNISLTRIESRPSKVKMWDYLFFIDMEGHIEDATIQTALKSLVDSAAWYKHLGSYPRSVVA